MAGNIVELFLFLIVGSFLYSVHCHEPCMLHVKDYAKTPVFRPLVYTEDGALYKSQNYLIKIPHGQVAFFSCQSNFFKGYPGRHNLTVKCDDDTLIVQHDSSKLHFKDLNCDLRPIEEGKHTVSECPKSSKGSYLQFYDGRQSAFNVLAEICYNYDSEQVTFVRVQLPYEAEPRTLHTENLASNVNIPHKIAMLSAYRADKTDLALKRILSDEFNFAQQGVVAVKLLPKLFFNEQLYEVEKFETNFVGIWTTISTGNWKRIMEDVNEYTKEKKKPLEVILGTHDKLKLNTPTGEEVNINLSEDKVPMPKYVWVIVHNKEKKQAVAIVTINNPFGTVDDIKKDMFCDNQCEKISWLHRTLKNKNYGRPIYGYTFCCSLDSFRLYPSLATATLLKD